MRIEWDLEGFEIPADKIDETFKKEIAAHFNLKWQIHFSRATPRMAIFVSRYSHCLHDILARYDSGEWSVEIPLIISNHYELWPLAEMYGIRFELLELPYIYRIDVEQ